MLSLPNVTVVGIDSYMPMRTLSAMLSTLLLINVPRLVLVTNRIFNVSNPRVKILPLLPTKDRADRERFMVTRITEAFETSHCLHMEWDSRVVNPSAFKQDWFQYDYIGAPWKYPMKVLDYPICTTENCVGNSGFSLISKKFADALARVSNPSRRDISDNYVCLKLRPSLEGMGLRFAPESVAERFSCEDRRYSGQFGWHGKGTAKINHFSLPMKRRDRK